MPKGLRAKVEFSQSSAPGSLVPVGCAEQSTSHSALLAQRQRQGVKGCSRWPSVWILSCESDPHPFALPGQAGCSDLPGLTITSNNWWHGGIHVGLTFRLRYCCFGATGTIRCRAVTNPCILSRITGHADSDTGIGVDLMYEQSQLS